MRKTDVEYGKLAASIRAVARYGVPFTRLDLPHVNITKATQALANMRRHGELKLVRKGRQGCKPVLACYVVHKLKSGRKQ